MALALDQLCRRAVGADRLADAPQGPALVSALLHEVLQAGMIRAGLRPTSLMSANWTCSASRAELAAQQCDLLGAQDHKRRLAAGDAVADESGCAVEELVSPGIQKCLMTKAGLHDEVSVHGFAGSGCRAPHAARYPDRLTSEHVKAVHLLRGSDRSPCHPVQTALRYRMVRAARRAANLAVMAWSESCSLRSSASWSVAPSPADARSAACAPLLGIRPSSRAIQFALASNSFRTSPPLYSPWTA